MCSLSQYKIRLYAMNYPRYDKRIALGLSHTIDWLVYNKYLV